MKGNRIRMESLYTSVRARGRPPKFALGDKVTLVWRPDAPTGVVIGVLADYHAAVDANLIIEEWWQMQRPAPSTPYGAFWYVVLLADRPQLAGEYDLVFATVGAA